MVAPVDIVVLFASREAYCEFAERFSARLSTGGGRIITREAKMGLLASVEQVREEIGLLPLGVIAERESDALTALEGGADEAISREFLDDAVVTRFLDRVLLRARSRRRNEIDRHELAQIEKLSALGTLIAGVGHELNNPLSTMLLGFDVLSEHMLPDLGVIWGIREQIRSGKELTLEDLERATAKFSMRAVDVRDLLVDISRAAEHVVQLVQDLRVFSRTNAVERVTLFQPRDVIEQGLRLVRREFGTNVAIEQDYEDNLPHLLLQRNRLAQVITNLLANAAHAMREVAREVHQVRISARMDDDAIAISISDTGPGISDENLEKIFDPFFTTKDIGRGTGLGLSISKSIIQDMGGDFSVSSIYGEGATFVCFLPLPTPEQLAAAGVATRVESITQRPHVKGSVLLVDDDENVLRAASRSLGKQFKVILARDGAEARELVLSGSRTDAVVTELALPELDGPDFIAWLRENRPEVAGRVVVATAAQERPEYRAFLEAYDGVVLHKPLGHDALLGAVTEVLQG